VSSAVEEVVVRDRLLVVYVTVTTTVPTSVPPFPSETV
jgi:hypothetical protein